MAACDWFAFLLDLLYAASNTISLAIGATLQAKGARLLAPK